MLVRPSPASRRQYLTGGVRKPSHIRRMMTGASLRPAGRADGRWTRRVVGGLDGWVDGAGEKADGRSGPMGRRAGGRAGGKTIATKEVAIRAA